MFWVSNKETQVPPDVVEYNESLERFVNENKGLVRVLAVYILSHGNLGHNYGESYALVVVCGQIQNIRKTIHVDIKLIPIIVGDICLVDVVRPKNRKGWLKIIKYV